MQSALICIDKLARFCFKNENGIRHCCKKLPVLFLTHAQQVFQRLALSDITDRLDGADDFSLAVIEGTCLRPEKCFLPLEKRNPCLYDEKILLLLQNRIITLLD